MRQSGRFDTDEIEVTKEVGNRTSDGFQKTGEATVLVSEGSFQNEGRALRERAAFYEAGDALFFTAKEVDVVSTGQDAVITTEGGRTITGSVEQVNPTDRSLLINFG